MTIPFENVFELIQNRFISNLELIIQIDKTWGLRHMQTVNEVEEKKIVLIKSSPGGATAAQILVVIANILKGTSKTELSGKGSI